LSTYNEVKNFFSGEDEESQLYGEGEPGFDNLIYYLEISYKKTLDKRIGAVEQWEVKDE
jgi:hypothetical protein